MTKSVIAIPNEKRLKKQFKRAMAQIVMTNPFFAMIVLSQDTIYTTNIPTMGVDGKSIYVNLNYIATLSPIETIGVLVHECLHLCWNHVTRRGQRDPLLWNYAGDYAINPIIKKEGFTLPPNVLDESRFHNMTAYEIYNILEKEQPITENYYMDLMDKNLSAADKKTIEHRAKTTLAKAIQVAGKSVPDAIKKDLDTIFDPSAPWENILREFMHTHLGDDDSTWRRPNKRYIHEDIYLPTLQGLKLPKLEVMLDTSGSIYNETDLLNKFTHEVNSIITDLLPEEVSVSCVDTSVQSHNIYEEGELPNYKIVGGGGTDFQSYFDGLLKQNYPACIIVFTDLYANGLPPLGYPIPILWCVYNNNTPNLAGIAGNNVKVS